jgi:hypothetical protein
MKATLEFNLDDNDDKMAHLRCVKATDMALALWDMDEYLRGEIKHAPDSISMEVFNSLQNVRNKLSHIMSNRNIDLNELIN